MSRLKRLCVQNVALRDELLALSNDLTSAKWRAEVKQRFGIWLSADSQVTRWRKWVFDILDQELLNDQMELRAERYRSENPGATAEEVRDDGIRYFMEKARANGDAKTFLLVLDRDQNERHGQTKAQIEERKVRVAETRIAQQSCELFLKWFNDKRAREIAESGLSNAEKIAALRKTYFADVDELEQSGAVQIPD